MNPRNLWFTVSFRPRRPLPPAAPRQRPRMATARPQKKCVPRSVLFVVVFQKGCSVGCSFSTARLRKHCEYHGFVHVAVLFFFWGGDPQKWVGLLLVSLSSPEDPQKWVGFLFPGVDSFSFFSPMVLSKSRIPFSLGFRRFLERFGSLERMGKAKVPLQKWGGVLLLVSSLSTSPKKSSDNPQKWWFAFWCSFKL